MKAQFDFRQIADGLDSGILILDSELRVIYVNNWVYQRSGLSPDRVLNLPFIGVFPEIADSRLLDCCQDAVKLRLPSRMSNSFNPTPLPLFDPQHVGNELYRLQQTVMIKPQEVEGVVFCELIVHDVTPVVIKENWLKRVASEQRDEALKRELEHTHLSRVIDNTADAILVFQQSGQIDMVNMAAEKMFGYSREEIRAMGLEQLLSGHDDHQRSFLYDRLNLLIGQAVSRRRELPSASVQAVLMRKDGSALPAEIKFSTSFSENAVSVITIIRDRSLEVESERVLKESENRFKTLAKVAPVGIFRTDASGILQYANEMWFRVTGLDESSLHSDSWFTAVHPAQRNEVMVDWNRRRAANQHLAREFRVRGSKAAADKDTWVLCNLMAEHDMARNITGFVGTITDISEQRRNQEEIERLAYYDSLTGLANRRFFKDTLDRSIKEGKRRGDAFALLALDLDEFKRVNDSLGHDAGDQLLIEVGKRLKQCLRELDVIARLGGDEFSIILNRFTEPEHVVKTASRIIQALTEPMSIANEWVTVSTSIGITVFPGDGEEVDVLIKNADLALYAAKDSGRNAYVFYNEKMNAQAETNLLLENRIRRGLANQEFTIFLQPQIETRTGRVACAEALVRWEDPHEGLLPPGEFIEMAEKSRLISKLGSVVLEKSCAETRRLLDSGVIDEHFRVAINVSGSQFLEPAFVFLVWKMLRRFQLPGKMLELEVTEGVFIRDLSLAGRVMSCLRGLGVAVALDDFGTGFSSLSYLRYLPVDTLKIDRSFVSGVGQGEDGSDIVLAIIDVAQRLNCTVVAEGVETESQFEFLKNAGCELAQGFWLARPMPLDHFERFLVERASTPAATDAHG